jgi:hypothetical protein
MAERIAKLATMAMIAVCPELNPIPVPTRKKPNSDQPIDDPLGLEHGARRRQARSVAI